MHGMLSTCDSLVPPMHCQLHDLLMQMSSCFMRSDVSYVIPATLGAGQLAV
jgi:hypothetical protein